MLFVSNPPVQVQIKKDRKIIILTQNRIMFSHLDFIEEYLSLPLVSSKPQSFYYSSETMQTLVKFPNALQIYYCDWKTHIKLLKVQPIEKSCIQNIYYDKVRGWNVVGNVKLYDNVRITYISPSPTTDQHKNILARCYINKNQYILTKQKLIQKQNDTQSIQILWKDRMMVLKNQNYEIDMIGAPSADNQRDILCINCKYIMIVRKKQVLSTFQFHKTIYINNSLLINEGYKKNYINISSQKIYEYTDLGSIPSFRGKIHSSYLYENQLVILSYSDKQIHINALPLVSQDDGKKAQNHQKKKLYGSISKIVQDSQQDASQFINQLKNKAQEQSLSPKLNINRNKKPIIRNISVEIDDRELGHTDQLDSKSSLVLQRSKMEGQQGSCRQSSKIHKNSNDIRQDQLIKEAIIEARQNSQNNDQPSKNNISVDSFRNSHTRFKVKKSKSKQNGSKGSNSNVHHYSQQMIEENTETPGFTNCLDWNSFDKKWGQPDNLQIKQDQQAYEDQSDIINQSQRSIIPLVPGIPTKKIQYFKPRDAQLTTELVDYIQSSSYTKLIRQACADHPQKFEDFTSEFMYQLLQQKQSALLFSQFIQTFNPEFTKDKIRRLFRLYLNKDIYKSQITDCLQQFKLSQVPPQALKFPLQFTQTIKTINKQIYISDLLHPSQLTINQFLEAYFTMTFGEAAKIIVIQDEQIDISLPRNMLNILLYLDNYLNLPLQSIFKVYCQKILFYDHLPVLKKIIQDQIFQICNVNRDILNQVIIQYFNENLLFKDSNYMWQVIQCLTQKVFDQYRIKLALYVEFDKNEIDYSIQEFLSLKQRSNSIYLFLQKLIQQNSCIKLLKISLSSVYKNLFWLQQGQKAQYMTNQYVLLVKNLIQKLCTRSFFSAAFRFLRHIHLSIKKSYIAYLLYKYANSKFINRLPVTQVKNLQIALPQFFDKKQVVLASLPKQPIVVPTKSPCFSCSWKQFKSVYQKHLTTQPQLQYLTYLDINCAFQLFLYLDELKKNKFQKFLCQIQDKISATIDDINENDESLNPKGYTNAIFDQIQPSKFHTNNSPDHHQYIAQRYSPKTNKNVCFNSMTLINHYNDIHQLKNKANSDKKASQDSGIQNQDIQRLKWLVSQPQILQALSEIYDVYGGRVFLKALKFVDLEKVKLYHLDAFRSIVNQNIDYPINRIISFNVFTHSDPHQAFEKIKLKIKAQLNLQNFWLIYMILQIMLSLGPQVAQMFLEKIIVYHQNDQLSQVVQQLIKVTQLRNKRNYLKDMAKIARDYHLDRIAEALVH